MAEEVYMSQIWVPLLAALLGAVIGSLTTIASIFVQTKAERKRERVRLAVETAIQEQKGHIASATKPGTRTIIPPLSTYVYFHASFLALLDEDRVTPETLRELRQKRDDIMRVAEEDQGPT